MESKFLKSMAVDSEVEKHLCNLIVPGFPKCGTSSLHEYLDQHPRITMSRPKESHYFSRNDVWQKGLSYHNSLFSVQSEKFQYYGDSSTTYCLWDPAIERIDQFLEAPKIVFVLRDPVKRTISHYKWLWAKGLERRSFRAAITESSGDVDPNKATEGCFFGYLQFSRYEEFVPKWSERFGVESVFVVKQEELRKEPVKVSNEVFSFLNLPCKLDIEKIEVNQTKSVEPVGKSVWVDTVAKICPLVLKEKMRSSPSVRKFLRASTRKRNIAKPAVSESDQEWLAEKLLKSVEFYNCQ